MLIRIVVITVASLLTGLSAVLMPAASANAKLASGRIPASLEILTRRMDSLSVNSEHVLIRRAIQSPRAPGSSSGSSRDRKKAGSGEHGLKTHWFKPDVYEVSLSPIRAVDRSGAPGHGRIEAIQVGDREYIHTSALGLPHVGRPWVWVKVTTLFGGLVDMAGKGPLSLIGKLRAEITRARSAVEVGPAMVHGHPTTEFAIETWQWIRLVMVGSSSGKHAKSKAIVRRQQRIDLDVFFEPNGLPVRIEEQEAFGGPLKIETLTEVLGTGMPVRVHAPPASETIGLAELEKRRKEEAARVQAGKSKQ